MKTTTDQQTLKDLEFTLITEWLKEYAIGPSSKDRIEQLVPSNRSKEIIHQLNLVHELVCIRREGESFPRLEIEEITEEIRMLPIHNAAISTDGFIRILRASKLINSLLHFFDKREQEYPLLNDLLANCHFSLDIVKAIEGVFDLNGEVRDDASEKLTEIRQEMRSQRKSINRNFDRELRKLQKLNYLGDTREAFISDRRVLTVLSQYKRKVPGTVYGSSKTGSLTYIEPKVNVPMNNELELLIDDERKELFRILQVLRKDLLEHLELIKAYQEVMVEFDFVNAKSQLALKLDCHLPKVDEERKVYLIDAWHPILRSKNDQLKKKTISQSIQMDKFSRMLVISGPNAGGKSITLKSIGLLQCMLQSGLLVPVHPNSEMSIFQSILSDIGDNQSIENELSTYSYRLKRMKEFIDVANRNSLLLLDEFGTGSDPDLGGALAESIFETLYSKKCFGIVTTHYSNIKLKADQLKNATNGCMLFNAETLDPLYQFSLGQPGSSFTFEVAEMNGIPQGIIESAKGKLNEKKVKLDQLLTDLQKEKNYLSKLNAEHIEAQELAQERQIKYEELRENYEEKMKSIRVNAENNDRFLRLGKKMQNFIDTYVVKSRKKTINDGLISEMKKYVAMEKSKLVAEVEKKKEVVKAKRKSQKAIKPKKDNFHRDKIKAGSKVKLVSTRQAGIVEEISGQNVVVTFGFARMKVSLDKLMWIE